MTWNGFNRLAARMRGFHSLGSLRVARSIHASALIAAVHFGGNQRGGKELAEKHSHWPGAIVLGKDREVSNGGDANLPTRLRSRSWVCREMRVPFNRAVVVGNEFAYMADTVGRLRISGDGYYSGRVARALEEIVGSRKALFTTSCTHALEMAAMLLDIAQGDEIIMPSFTFVSMANAFVLRGGKPVFVDIRSDTLNVDERLIEGAITSRTRAIVVVHYAGVACEMKAICSVALRHGIPVIEDNAHGLFGFYNGRPLGSFGLMATQSFHETKNVMCGEGGALLLNHDGLVARAEIIREKGTNRSRFFRGEVDRYTWIEPGSSYLGSDLLAAFLFAQLEKSREIQQRRQMIWERYAEELRSWACERDVQTPTVPLNCTQPYHLFYLIMPSMLERDAILQMLAQRGVNALFHYVPLHQSEYGAKLGYRVGDLPVTESHSSRLLRLPMFNDMTAQEQSHVLESVMDFMPRRPALR